MLGYPTGLGALLVRRRVAHLLNRVYFGGGTVDMHLGKFVWRFYISFKFLFYFLRYRVCRIPIRHFFSQSRRLLTKIFKSAETVNEKFRCL
jgi:hypothetical protein